MVKINRKKTFVKFFISYIAILLIPVIIGSFIYIFMIGVIEKETQDKNRIIVQQTRDTVDGYFMSVDKITKQLALDTRIIQLLQNGNQIEGIDLYNVYIAQNEFSILNLTNDFIASYYIYLKDSNMVITQGSSYSNPELFYRNYFDVNMSGYSSWLSKIKNQYHNQEYQAGYYYETLGKNKPIITCYQSLPLNTSGQVKGCIAIMIDEVKIRKLLEPISTDKGGWFYIQDKDGNIIDSSPGKWNDIEKMHEILSGSKEDMVKSGDMLATYTVSSLNNWRYVAVVPVSSVMAQALLIKKITLIITLAVLIAGVIIALLASYQNNKPIKRIIKTVVARSGLEVDLNSENEYDILEVSFDKLIDNNEHLKKAMFEQMILFRSAFYQRLIKGEFKNLKEIDALSDLSQLNIKGSSFIVIILQLVDFTDIMSAELLDELERKKILIKGIISNCTKDKGHVHDIESDKIMILLCLDEVEQNKVFEHTSTVISSIISQLGNGLNSRFIFGVGNSYANLLDVYKSFNEANQSLENPIKGIDTNIFWYSDIPVRFDGFFYPFEDQNRLFYLVKSGQKDEMNNLLNQIFIENFSKRKLSIDGVKLMLYALYSTLLNIKLQLKIKNEDIADEMINDISVNSTRKNLKQWYEKLRLAFSEICDIIIVQKTNYKNNLIDEVVEYIEKNYSDAQLALCNVADRFGLSETNLSYYFKERTSYNFSTYLENLRIEKACELLKTQGIPVNEIADRVGYNSDHSFRRAFKRLKAVTPTEFKKDM